MCAVCVASAPELTWTVTSSPPGHPPSPVGIVPYSPLGRGELTGALELGGEDDFRASLPRFQRGNRERNLLRVERLEAVAEGIGCTPAQLALAWLLAQGEDVVPIPGTKRTACLEENAAAADIRLSDAQRRELDELFEPGETAGDRYLPDGMDGVEL